MKKKLFLVSLIPATKLVFPSLAQAVCPVCTIAVGAGLGISKSLGIDDTVTSVWIGGLILSSSFWLVDWLGKRKWFVKYKKYNNIYVIALLMYLLFLVPLYTSGIIGLANNTFWGIDKILFGTAVGSIVFLKGVYLDKLQRQKFGKQLFNYQKVVFPVTMLTLASVIFYFITK